MSNWSFHFPVGIVFGAGRAREIPALAAALGARPVLVIDAALPRLPWARALAESLSPVAVFSDIRPNPTVANVDALASVLRRERADVAVAVGGGSSLDCAKAAAALAAAADASIRPYHSGGKAFARPGPPLIAVPTTAGTGSEATPISVLDDEEKDFKSPFASPFFYPAKAVVDPELCYSLPKAVTASTGLDALSHAIEGYWSKNRQPICDALALEAARTIFAHLATACREPENAAAREAMSYGALLAGIAFHMPKNAIIHACSFPLSNRFHLPHGVACALTMEEAIRLNAPHMGGRMEAFAAACGFADIDGMTAAIRRLKREGGLPCTLSEAGVPEEAVPELIDGSFHPLMKNNPKEVTREDLEMIYRRLKG